MSFKKILLMILMVLACLAVIIIDARLENAQDNQYTTSG